MASFVDPEMIQVFNEREVPTDLHAFGNASKPREPREKKDVYPNDSGTVGPEFPPLAMGASTFGDPNQSGLTGHFHRLPLGTLLPDGLAVVADGVDSIPSSPHAPTHHTIYPSREMALSDFVVLFQGLPWVYGGKR